MIYCNKYKELGFKNRHEYLLDLAYENCVDYLYVESLAQLLGPSEDFDGLVNAIKDMKEV